MKTGSAASDGSPTVPAQPGWIPPALAGDRVEERFLREVPPCSDHLFYVAQRMTTRRADAEDLVQETMLRAYLRFDTFEAGGNIKAWLRKIMVNHMIDTHRTAKRRPSEDLIGCMSSENAEFVDRYRPEARSAEDHVIDAMSCDIAKAVRALPDDLRLIVYFADLLGYRNTEIADLCRRRLKVDPLAAGEN